MRKFVKPFIYGAIIGFGSPVPGVSAGTVAILLNVYDYFFENISVSWVKKNIGGVISFAIGCAVGLLGIANIMVFLFDNHPMITGFVFMGLILGCVPLIFKKATTDKVKPVSVIVGVVALGLMILLAFFGDDTANRTIAELGCITPATLAWIFGMCVISSASMLIPGVGGSLMMIALGIYQIYIEALATFNFLILGVLLVGMVLGILAGIYITKKVLEKFSQALYFAILGFVLGSVLVIFPGFCLNLTGGISIFAAGGAFCFAYWLSKKVAC